MSHPVHWPNKVFFYAIGNTAPVCLTEGLAPEEPADVLLLGCGDPRNILFTIFVSGVDKATHPRTLDITCCDVEPAVLARNILLFTLVVDDEASERIDKIWNIFYHFYLDDSSLSLLVTQCRKLVELSQSLHTWQNGKYASFLRMCTRRTLSELRRYWMVYVKTQELSQEGKQLLKKNFTDGVKSVAQSAVTLTAARSAGPLWMAAAPITSEGFNRYWETGTTFSDPKSVAAATSVNPTFIYSRQGERFSVHYGTDPLSSFPLAAAFAPMGSGSKSQNKSTELSNVVRSVRSHFREWCLAFKVALATHGGGHLIIRFFAGDALAFCRALRDYSVSGTLSGSVYAAPWSSSRLDLDGGDYSEDPHTRAPSKFNVINTSNLIDHVGLLNLLVVTIPILSRTPSSAIYTEALLSSGRDATTAFVERLCTDVSLFSLLIGVAPSSFVSNFTTHSNIHEILSYYRLMKSKDESKQFHERVIWKVPSLGDTLAFRHDSDICRPTKFDPDQLAKAFLGIYHEMFAFEDHSRIMQDLSMRTFQDSNVVHYMRHSFAALLRIVKDNVDAGLWVRVMDTFTKLVETDRKILLGMNHYQDLCCHLHIFGVFSVDTLTPRWIANMGKVKGWLRDWDDIPPVVCVVLVVPRKHLKVLEEDVERIGTPMLQCETLGESGQHGIFSSFQPVFGTVTITGSKGNQKVVLEDDPSGLSGSSPLVVSFWIPSWILLGASPQVQRVQFGVRSTPTTAVALTPKLGPMLTLYTVDLADKKHVYLTRERPNLSNELKALSKCAAKGGKVPTVTSTVSQVTVGLNQACQQIATLMVKANITDNKAKSVLSSGVAVKVEQASPCAAKIVFGGVEQIVAFPFPIDVYRAKLRVARKSSYVEVIVPVSGPNISGGFSVDNFPVIVANKCLTLWNIHRLHLDRLPVLDTANPKRLEWLGPHISLQLSDRERATRDEVADTRKGSQDVLMHIKDSLHSIFIRFAGIQGQQSRVFGLTETPKGGVYTLIFVIDLRFDLGSHTVVADAFVLPLAERIMQLPVISRNLQRLVNRGFVHVNTNNEEMKAWKRLLPVLTERCREWKHKDTCEYISVGQIPLSLDYAESPICECGRGMDIDAFSKVGEWKELTRFVTRAALGPLFSVSYLESVAGVMKGFGVESASPDGCAKCGGKGKPRLLLCSRCKQVRYCSAACQKENWTKHKLVCGK